MLAEDAPEHMEVSRTCPDSGTDLELRVFDTFKIPILASSPPLSSLVQGESNIRDIRMGKYILKLPSELPNEPCPSVLGGKKICRWGKNTSLGPDMQSVLSPHIPLH